jgi:DNA-binding Lrp family transcriptional regulator
VTVLRAWIFVETKPIEKEFRISEQSASIKGRLGELAQGVFDLLGIYDVVVESSPGNLNALYQDILKRIYEIGFVTGCTTYPAVGQQRTKPGTLGKPFAYILISASPVSIDYIQEKVYEMNEIQKVDIVLGPYDLVAELSVDNMKKLTDTVNRILRIDGVLTTVTMPVIPE